MIQLQPKQEPYPTQAALPDSVHGNQIKLRKVINNEFRSLQLDQGLHKKSLFDLIDYCELLYEQSFDVDNLNAYTRGYLVFNYFINTFIIIHFGGFDKFIESNQDDFIIYLNIYHFYNSNDSLILERFRIQAPKLRSEIIAYLQNKNLLSYDVNELFLWLDKYTEYLKEKDLEYPNKDTSSINSAHTSSSFSSYRNDGHNDNSLIYQNMNNSLSFDNFKTRYPSINLKNEYASNLESHKIELPSLPPLPSLPVNKNVNLRKIPSTESPPYPVTMDEQFDKLGVTSKSIPKTNSYKTSLGSQGRLPNRYGEYHEYSNRAPSSSPNRYDEYHEYSNGASSRSPTRLEPTYGSPQKASSSSPPMKKPLPIAYPTTYNTQPHLSPPKPTQSNVYNGHYNNKSIGNYHGTSSHSNSADSYINSHNSSHQQGNNHIHATPQNPHQQSTNHTYTSQNSHHQSYNHAPTPQNSHQQSTTARVQQAPPPLPKAVVHRPQNQPPICRLRNPGSSCYVNLTIQLLFGLETLMGYFVNSKHHQYIKNPTYKNLRQKNEQSDSLLLSDAVAGLLVAFHKFNGSAIAPKKFLRISGVLKPDFNIPNEQQDAQEFLLFVLERLHEELSEKLELTDASSGPVLEDYISKWNIEVNPKDKSDYLKWYRTVLASEGKSPIHDIFQGHLQSKLICNKCGHASISYSPFTSLSLPIPSSKAQHVDLSDCLRYYTQDETLSGENAWNCPKCNKDPHRSVLDSHPVFASKKSGLFRLGKRHKSPTKDQKSKLKSSKVYSTTTKSLTFIKLPQVLLIHLARFSIYNLTDKLDTPIQYPLELRFNNNSHEIRYKLTGIINHYGNLKSGHYTALVNKSTVNNGSSTDNLVHPFWCFFDDDVCKANVFHGDITKPGMEHVRSRDVYVLCYERI